MKDILPKPNMKWSGSDQCQIMNSNESAKMRVDKEMVTQKYNKIEYMCTWCGKRVQRAKGEGRPLPGTCPRKTFRGNTNRPHTWIINKKLY